MCPSENVLQTCSDEIRDHQLQRFVQKRLGANLLLRGFSAYSAMRTLTLAVLVTLCMACRTDAAIVVDVTFDLTKDGLVESDDGSASGTSLAFKISHTESPVTINANLDLSGVSSRITANDAGTGGFPNGVFMNNTLITFTEPETEVTGGAVTFEGFTSITLVEKGGSSYSFNVTDPITSESIIPVPVTGMEGVFAFAPIKTFNLSHANGTFQVSEVTARYLVNATGEASAVPEPASAIGLAIAGSIFLIRRRWS